MRAMPPSGKHETSSAASYVRRGVIQVRADLAFTAFANFHELLVVPACFRCETGQFRGVSRAVDRSKSIRLLLERRLVFFEGVGGTFGFEEHIAEKFVGRRERSRRDGGLLGG